MIRAIFFDLDGTLLDRVPLWRRCLERFHARHRDAFPPGPASEQFRHVLSAVANSLFLTRRRVARLLAPRFPGLAPSAAEIEAELTEHLLAAVEPDPEILRLLEGLAPRYKLAILTNGSRRVQRAKIRRAGLARAAGQVFISGELGTRKPDPAIFRRALDWAGVAPDDALIVGDHPHEDIFGGQRVGLLTCAVGDRYRPTWPLPDFRIGRAAELPGVLP